MSRTDCGAIAIRAAVGRCLAIRQVRSGEMRRALKGLGILQSETRDVPEILSHFFGGGAAIIKYAHENGRHWVFVEGLRHGMLVRNHAGENEYAFLPGTELLEWAARPHFRCYLLRSHDALHSG